jgi:hypothetical protein
MSFTIVHTPPKIDSTVTVKFAGLLLLKPNGDKMCDIGINRQPGHAFQLMLIVDKPDLPLTLLRLSSGPLTGDVKITNSASTAAFKVFTRDDNPFDRAAANNNPLDARWALHLTDYHPGADFDNGARPIVTLNDGLLYASNLSRLELNPMLVTPQPPPSPPTETPLHRVAADVSASFDLAGSDKVSITWEEAGHAQSFGLPRIQTVDPIGTTYTIVVLNDPPATSEPPHDELALYYEVLKVHGNQIPPNERKQLVFKVAAKSDEIPCLPGLLNP